MIPDNSSNDNDLSASTFEQLFFDHYKFLCAVASKYVDDIDIAKDLVQDFFIYYWEKRARIKHSVSFERYAGQAVKYIALGHLKREKLLLEKINSYNYQKETVSNIDQDVETLQQLERIDQLIAESIDKLPAKRREIFLLSNQKKVSYNEIAKSKGVSVNTVKTHVRLAYESLRKDLSNEKLFTFIFFILLK